MNKIQNKDNAHSKAFEATQLWDANKDPNSEKALMRYYLNIIKYFLYNM